MQNDRTQETSRVSINVNKKLKKGIKKQQNIQLDEEVVYNLIYSINMFANRPVEMQKVLKDIQQHKQQYNIPREDVQKTGIRKSDINQIINNKIKPIPFTMMNEIKMKLRSSLRQIYLNKKVSDKLQSTRQSSSQKPVGVVGKLTDKHNRFEEIMIVQSIDGYVTLSQLLKEASIPTPIQEGFYQQYAQLWQQLIQNLKNQQRNSNGRTCLETTLQCAVQSHKVIKQNLLKIWTDIPHSVLNKHLTTFQIVNDFVQITQEKIIRLLTSLLIDNKIQQSCTYYEIYHSGLKSTDKFQQASKILRQFEDEILIPKITKSDHIFSLHVLSLLKSNTHLKERLLNSSELEPAIGLRVIDLLKEDGREYYNIHMYILRQHYKSIIYDHKYWYMVEDKLSFNKNFIEWYVQDLSKVLLGKITNDKLQKIGKQISGVKNVEDLQLSILQRNNVIDLEHTRMKGKQFTRIHNPLYKYDRFDCAQLIIEQQNPQTKDKTSTIPYLRLEQFGIRQEDIRIVDSISSKQFSEMRDNLLNYKNKPIGFDTEFRCISTKYQQQGVSLIQLSTPHHHYIIDFLKLENQPQFYQFIVQLLCNEEYIKVGHTISSDIKYLKLTLQIPQNESIKSFVDITAIFKSLNPTEKLSSLSFMCLKFLNRKMSKYQQRSNWNRRPLKKTQLHYAVLDSLACLMIYEKMKPEYEDFVLHGKVVNKFVIDKNESKQKEVKNEKQEIATQQQSQQTPVSEIETEKQAGKLVGDMYRSERFLYHKKYEDLVSSQQPRFLIDNMLKKLSAVMRNCGLDAEYIAVRDYQLATEIAQKQHRIILTRDNKFFQRKDNKIPIYLIKQRTDSDRMFQQVKMFFKLDLSRFKTLSRCVKCNGPELVVISKQEAMNEIKFKYEDSPVTEFWRCTKCRQIYWEGGMFERAKEKYAKMKS